MKANDFVKKYGWDNAELLLNSSKPIQQKYFRKLKTPCGDVIDAEELMSLVLDKKTRDKVSRIGFDNLKEFVSVFEIDREEFGSNIVSSCYISRLKRIVESWELVEKVGGMDKAKMLLRMRIAAELYESADEIEKAIADVESCQ